MLGEVDGRPRSALSRGGLRDCASSALLAGDCGLFPQSDTFRLELAKDLDVLF
jgi:hypothetical protein